MLCSFLIEGLGSAIGRILISKCRLLLIRGSMTRESLPVDKSAGDEMSSGTVNQFVL